MFTHQKQSFREPMEPHELYSIFNNISDRTYVNIGVLPLLVYAQSGNSWFLTFEPMGCIHQSSHLTAAPPTKSARITGSENCH